MSPGALFPATSASSFTKTCDPQTAGPSASPVETENTSEKI
jgi:hypothetical protein